jgi:hypothetical protein
MNKESQFEQFLVRLRNREEIVYTFYIDPDWLEKHGSFENYSIDWIEVITERFTDDDSYAIELRWRMESEQNIIVLERSDDDSQWYRVASFNPVADLEHLKEFFEISNS